MNITFRDVLNIFFRYFKQILFYTILVIALMSVYYFFTKKEYVSESKILIRLGQEQMGGLSILDAKDNVYITRREQEIKNEIEIMTTGAVIEASAKKILGADYDFKEFNKVKSYLKENLKAEAFYDSDTINVSFSFPDPHLAQEILQIIIDEYIQHHISVFTDTTELRLIESKMGEVRQEYEASLKDLSTFEAQNNVYGDEQLRLLLETRETLRQTMADTESALEYSMKKKGHLEEILATVPRYESFSSVEVLNEHHEQLKQRLDEAKIKKLDLLTRYSQDSRSVKDVNQEIQLLEDLLAESPAKIIGQTDNRLSNAYQSINPIYLEMESEVSGQKARLEKVKGQLVALDRELAEHSHIVKTHEFLNKNVEMEKETYEKYYKNFVESNIENLVEQNKMTNISIVESPLLQLEPVTPNKKKTLFVGLLLVFAGNFFMLLLLVMMDNTVSRPENIKDLGQAHVIASIPNRDSLTNLDMDSIDNVLDDIFIDLQKMYTSISSNHPDDKVFLLAETQHNEGATKIGFLMSAFLAKYQAKRVAFVNFSGHHLSEYFPSSLSEKLSNGTVIHNVSVFQTDDSFSETILTGEDNVYSIAEKIKDEFDYVFLAINPIQVSPELLCLNRTTDAALLFIEAERTKIHSVHYNIDLLSQYGFEKINLILTNRRFYIPHFIYNAI